MEESALLTNITTIIAKDMLIDEGSNLKAPKHFLWHGNNSETSAGNDMRYPLLAADDDEDLEFFLKQQFALKKSNTERKRKSSANCYPQKVVKFSKSQSASLQSRNNVFRPRISKPKELNLLNEFHNVEFEGFLHMSKMSFLKTFQFIKHLLGNSTFPAGMPPQTVFSLSLWKLTTDEHFEEISRRFNIANVSDIIGQFWNIISDKYESYIKWPNSQLSQQIQIQGFQKHAHLKCFPNLFGVIAIKRIDIFLASEDSEIPIILQIVCNVDQKVVDCFVELEQEYNFDETPMGQILALNENTMPKGCYLIGDKSFPLKSYLIKPFSNPCFRKEEQFNILLDPALKLAQDTLDVMAKRFNALYALEAKDLTEVRKILETICALHNLSVAIEDDYVDRKREVVTFNWATASNGLDDAVGSEQNIQGLLKRSDLVDIVLEQK